MSGPLVLGIESSCDETSVGIVRGTKVQEDGDWYVIQLVNGNSVKIRQSEVVRIDAGPGNKIRPAIND